MHILVTGAQGLVGHDIIRELRHRGHRVTGCYHESGVPGEDDIRLDITDPHAVREAIFRLRPEAVIHCAAWTAVDAAEDPENQPKVRSVNVDGTRNLAQVCLDIGCKLLFFSTDYVFSGQGTEPWTTECTEFAPCNLYGQTKLEAEQLITRLLDRYFILRISWVFGSHGRNFVSTMLNLARKYPTLRVVDDQVGNPTYTRDLARLTADMIGSDRYGLYHVSNEGECISWYEFAREIFRRAGTETNVIPVSTQEYGLSKAARPLNSRLDRSKLIQNGFRPLPHWQDALDRYLQEMKEHLWDTST